MTRDWAVFDSTAVCPKCAHDDIGTSYRRGYQWNMPGSIDGEWLERTCQRCHYSWPEETLDPTRGPSS